MENREEHHAEESQGCCGGDLQVMWDINAHRTKIFNTDSLTYAALKFVIALNYPLYIHFPLSVLPALTIIYLVLLYHIS